MADLRRVADTLNIPDVGTAVTVCIPITEHNKGKLTRVTTCLGGAITGADSLVVISRNATALGTITVANTSSAVGDIDYLDLNAEFSVGDYIKIANGGESTGVATLGIVLDFVR